MKSIEDLQKEVYTENKEYRNQIYQKWSAQMVPMLLLEIIERMDRNYQEVNDVKGKEEVKEREEVIKSSSNSKQKTTKKKAKK